MVQFYCLSVVMNIFAGLILVYGVDLTKEDLGLKTVPEPVDSDSTEVQTVQQSKKKRTFKGLNSRSIRFLIGLISVLVGFVKLFSSYRGIVILGDLLPSVVGLAGGASILLEFYTVTTSAEEFELNDKLKAIFIDSRKYIGVACFITALLHFIIPQVIIV
ncbi:MAG: hypothetical protein II563_04305 [Treponema sp.]|nr:hypothetical protein [Treponema sp.]MBQ2552057.1 hypothetical protein [Treponema sp.]MBQ4236534.1 hypothetical protein [Treponema sp.]MBQ5384077.1 hypothetical protein [Treponema sp.]